MIAAIDLTGQRFGKLLVVRRDGSRRGQAWWLCACDCGGTTGASTATLRLGRMNACRCSHFRHGHTSAVGNSKTYQSWQGMLSRCRNPNNKRFHHYGGRGITVCDRWHDFRLFLEDMGERPADLTLDRIDVNGNYEPGNCRWATKREQYYNVRVARGPNPDSISGIARRLGVDRKTVRRRLRDGTLEMTQ